MALKFPVNVQRCSTGFDVTELYIPEPSTPSLRSKVHLLSAGDEPLRFAIPAPSPQGTPAKLSRRVQLAIVGLAASLYMPAPDPSACVPPSARPAVTVNPSSCALDPIPLAVTT